MPEPRTEFRAVVNRLSHFSIRPPVGVPEDHSMAMELSPGSLRLTRGTVVYPPAFDVV